MMLGTTVLNFELLIESHMWHGRINVYWPWVMCDSQTMNVLIIEGICLEGSPLTKYHCN